MENKKYLLHLTAEEIDQRLRDVENKQDKIEPGDYLEIEDGTLKMTFGQETGKTIEIAEEIVRFENLTFESDSSYSLLNRTTYGKDENEPEYFYSPEFFFNNGPEYLETINVNLITSDGDMFKYITKADFVTDDPVIYVFCNIIISEDGYPAVEDVNKPGFLIYFYPEGNIYYSSIQSLSDLSGSTISVVKNPTIEKETIKLPDSALKGENFIKIKDGIVRTTFGQTVTKEKTICLLDDYTDFSLDEDSNLFYMADSSLRAEKTLPAIGSDVDIYLIIEDYIIDKEYLATYNNIKVQLFEDSETPILFVNTEQTVEEILENGFVKIDETKPAFIILWGEYDDDKENWDCEAVASEDLTDIYFKIFNKFNETSIVKIPDIALPEVDQFELSGMPNHLVSSYLIDELLYDKQDKLYFDSYPIENSQNMLRSGAIYSAIKNIEDIGEKQLNGAFFPEMSGLSANKKVHPITEGAWIEGQGAWIENTEDSNVPNIFTLPFGSSGYPVLDVITTTNEKSVVTTAKIKNCSIDTGYLSEFTGPLEIKRIIDSIKLVNLTFQDDPFNQYQLEITKITSEIISDRVNFSMDFKFLPNKNTFPLNGTFTKTISSLTCYPGTGQYSHSEGNGSFAFGNCSHAEGYKTLALAPYSHVQGKFNIEDKDYKYAHIVGNGTGYNHYSNAHTLDWDGNAWYAGNIEGMGIIADNIKTNSLIMPIKEVITELKSVSYSGIIGQNLLTLGKEYLVTYNGVEYRLTCENVSGRLVLGNMDEFGFYIYQDSDNTTSAFGQNSNDTITLSKIEVPNMDLANYIKELENRIQSLENQLSEK